MIATLRQRNFALFWFGGLISAAGDWVLMVGLPIYVFILTKSVLATSVTLISGVAPMILLSSVAGVFVDRWNRQRTLVVVNILLALGLLPLLLVRSADDMWIIAAVNFIETCLEQFVPPAQSAILPAIAGEERIVPANSLNSLSFTLARLGGPPLGGLIAGLYGINGMVAADGASFIIAAFCLARMHVAHVPAVSGSEVVKKRNPIRAIGRMFGEWADGLRMIATRPILRVLVVILAFTSLGEGFFGTLYPVFVYQELHGGALEIGELMSAQAVGGLFASLLVGWAGRHVMSRWLASLGWLGFGVVTLAICYAPALAATLWTMATGTALPIPIFWVELGLFAAVGIPGLIGATGTISLLQTRSPDTHRGRIFGAQGAISGIMVLIGAAVAGTLPNVIGVVAVLSGQGWAKIVAGLIMLFFLPAVAKPAKAAAEKTTQPAAVTEPPSAEEVAGTPAR
jgi:MFS family permease